MADRRPVTDAIGARLARSFDMFDDLASDLTSHQLLSKLPVPSNTPWGQMWCVVGARESYAKAIVAGEWPGFACSLTAADRGEKGPLVEALRTSRSDVERAMAERADSDYALDLLLHEAQHQGQVIRYLLGLELPVPDSWAQTWNI